ncbi:uncharacterized protein Z518_08556 [Rhinocladiella mackenziei CBS 650.93]|uniref:Rhinocladiella mackenziei CBS 650.93 unplaced genomic scaffold supercont1.6, whole genome shotgun sequence n=1 Tax=Rhinocladiella mackenziei CBS 650.93 TaxID=1442369 RepID=A0A0D2I9Q7_9EURO|nr:uncharacterized protein Z518_08556 [Rhinocladiella mackenziei CBS 650.93]KIX02614.1 hypothetical protein Z518_08556 [Rhinocladiella mackenziei CBS 650.93]
MPSALPSSKKATVSYAIDLLRAHQIRRENAFLHEELQTWRKEIVAMRDEIKDLSAAVHVSRTIFEKDPSTFEQKHDTGLRKRSHGLESLRKAWDNMRDEISTIRIGCDRTRHNEELMRAKLDDKLEAVRIHFQNAADALLNQQGDIIADVKGLQHTIDSKAEASLVESLLNRVNEVYGPSPDSVSRIQDTFEHRGSSCAAGNPTVQVQDSQRIEHRGNHCLSRETDYHVEHPRKPTEETLPEDLDLDANANTVNSAGYWRPRAEENGALQLLPPPEADTSPLSSIKALKQGSFEGWESYYSRGMALVESAPHCFEETIVREFVEGMLGSAQKRQCHQWLDSKGWNWENISLFRNRCSELDITSTFDYSRKIEDNRTRLGQSITRPKLTVAQRNRHGGQPQTSAGPLRRSRRLHERNSRAQGQPTEYRPKFQSSQLPETKVPDNNDSIAFPDVHSTPRAKSRNIRTPTKRGPQLNNTSNETSDEQSLAKLGEPKERTNISTRKKAGSPERLPTLTARNAPEKRPKGAEFILQESESTGHRNRTPQLVPLKRPAAESNEDSSDDAVFPYTPEISARLRLPTAATRQNRSKGRRLPLPPPPEIPILSTSSDEEPWTSRKTGAVQARFR